MPLGIEFGTFLLEQGFFLRCSVKVHRHVTGGNPMSFGEVSDDSKRSVTGKDRIGGHPHPQSNLRLPCFVSSNLPRRRTGGNDQSLPAQPEQITDRVESLLNMHGPVGRILGKPRVLPLPAARISPRRLQERLCPQPSKSAATPIDQPESSAHLLPGVGRSALQRRVRACQRPAPAIDDQPGSQAIIIGHVTHVEGQDPQIDIQ